MTRNPEQPAANPPDELAEDPAGDAERRVATLTAQMTLAPVAAALADVHGNEPVVNALIASAVTLAIGRDCESYGAICLSAFAKFIRDPEAMRDARRQIRPHAGHS